MSLGIIVHCLACIAQRLLSSDRFIRYASLASCKVMTAVPWNLIPVMNSWPISWTSLMNGSFLIATLCFSDIFLFLTRPVFLTGISFCASPPSFSLSGLEFWPSSFLLSCRLAPIYSLVHFLLATTNQSF